MLELAVKMPGVSTYLGSYQSLCQRMTLAYEKIQGTLGTRERENEWIRTISSLELVCSAVETFNPIVPPRNWSSGQLIQYIGNIPEGVRAKINIAEKIFGNQQILIYDANNKSFTRPRPMEPMAIGFIDLAGQRIYFLIAQWDDSVSYALRGKMIISVDRSIERITNLLTVVNGDKLPNGAYLGHWIDSMIGGDHGAT